MADPLEQNPRLPAAPFASSFSGETAAPVGQSYRSLPVTALIGFSIAALFAAGIALLALVGLFSRKPLLLSGWTALLPMSAVLLCLLARASIRASEGTLAGEALVRWGLLLSLFVGFTYWAYYAAVYAAIRQQASAFATGWLEQLREADTARAAIGILPPLKRLELRENEIGFAAELEQLLSRAEVRGKQSSLFNLFYQFPLVRVLAQAGKDGKIVPRGIRSWGYIEGGYRVVLDYDIETPEGTFEATVAVHGTEAPNNEYERRQWYVELNHTRLNQDQASIRYTPFGENIARVNENAKKFLTEWKNEMSNPSREGSFVLTLPTAEREQALAELHKAARLGAAAGPLGASMALPIGSAIPGLTKFVNGSTVRLEPKRFTIPENERDEIMEQVRYLAGMGLQGRMLEMADSPPIRKLEGGRIWLSYDVQISEPGNFLAECVVDLEGDANALASSNTDAAWRVAALRIVSGRKTPMQRPPGMGGPSQPPAN
jgi:hypothetical protein